MSASDELAEAIREDPERRFDAPCDSCGRFLPLSQIVVKGVAFLVCDGCRA